MSFWKLLRLPLLNAYHLRHLHLYSLQNITHNFFEINRPISNMTWVYHSPPIIRHIFLLFAFEFAFYRRLLKYRQDLFILVFGLCHVRTEKICVCLNVTYITVEHSLFQRPSEVAKCFYFRLKAVLYLCKPNSITQTNFHVCLKSDIWHGLNQILKNPCL